MDSLMETLGRALGGSNLGQISRGIGADEASTGNALAAALPALIGALSRNASRGDGASALSNALERDHDGSILDNLGGFLNNPEAGPGEGILGHVLGSNRPRVESGLSRATNLDTGSISKLLVTLAPVVMGALGKTQRSARLGPNELSRMLNQESEQVAREAPQSAGMLSQLLDADKDGDVDISDLAKHGFGMLGKMFRR